MFHCTFLSTYKIHQTHHGLQQKIWCCTLHPFVTDHNALRPGSTQRLIKANANVHPHCCDFSDYENGLNYLDVSDIQSSVCAAELEKLVEKCDLTQVLLWLCNVFKNVADCSVKQASSLYNTVLFVLIVCTQTTTLKTFILFRNVLYFHNYSRLKVVI